MTIVVPIPVFRVPEKKGAMSDLDSSKHINTSRCYSRRLEEVFVEDYSKEKELERKIKQGKDKEQNQNKGPVDSELSKIKPKIQDCGLNPGQSARIEGT